MGYQIKKVERIVADGIDLNTAKIIFDNGLKLDITYDRLKRNLIVHRWYKLEDKQHNKLRAELNEYFTKLIEQETGSAA